MLQGIASKRAFRKASGYAKRLRRAQPGVAHPLRLAQEGSHLRMTFRVGLAH